ncbi:MAG: hypothetical protein LBL58_07965 [Tannerellaceae bacterium]|jgi:hypothetical protein|nr:hypothetical protein [Tannerellaceae bacterium]
MEKNQMAFIHRYKADKQQLADEWMFSVKELLKVSNINMPKLKEYITTWK